MNYHLVQLGCQMNLSDAERIATVLANMGYQRCETEEEADLLGVVACSVRQKAINKAYSKINLWNKWKRSRTLLTFVSGCVLNEDREKFLKRFDLVFSINDLPQLPEMIGQYGVTTPFSVSTSHIENAALEEHERPKRPIGPMWMGESQKVLNLTLAAPAIIDDKHQEALRRSTLLGIKVLQQQIKEHGGAQEIVNKSRLLSPIEDPMGGFWDIQPSYNSSYEAFVPIQNGCDKFCTFCAVPYTRGREVSRPSAEILREVATLIDRGYKSITLLGQNVNSYGQDAGELSFAQLLHQIGILGQTSGKKFWVYFTAPHPRDMDDEVLKAVATYDCLAKQIHLPLQSGDDKVLLRMNRKHSVGRYRDVIASIRRLLPTATLFTDIIVGFSGETIEQFENTKAAMHEFDYQMAFVAMYSPRPGAAASRWDDDVELEEKKRRLEVLTKVLHQDSLAFNQRYIGQTMTVLVERPDRKAGYWNGRNEGKIQVRFASQAEAVVAAGSMVQVKITSTRSLSMEGELVQ